MNIAEIILLLGAHAIGDYALQSDYIAKEKQRDVYVLFMHALIWTTSIAIMTLLLGLPVNGYNLLFILLLPHILIDHCKNINYCGFIPTKYALAFDQSLHFVQLTIWLLTYVKA
mgnify:CR=1 FL=1